jgi:nucleotide-binding universal stress UspA family protein
MKTILVLTDFSENAENAARYAAELSNHLTASKIILYHSFELPLTASEIPIINAGMLDLGPKSTATLSNLKRGLTQINPAIDIEIRTGNIPLLLAINNIIKEEEISWIVIGATGKSNVEKILIGSNSLNIIKARLAPVLVIPKNVRFQPIRKIVFACDLKRVYESTPVQEIKKIREMLKAHLLVLNVEKEYAQYDPISIKEQTALHQLLDGPHVTYSYINHTDKVEGVLNFAAEKHAELIISIPKEYGFFETIFHRSMSQKLVNHAQLPLLFLNEPNG